MGCIGILIGSRPHLVQLASRHSWIVEVKGIVQEVAGVASILDLMLQFTLGKFEFFLDPALDLPNLLVLIVILTSHALVVILNHLLFLRP